MNLKQAQNTRSEKKPNLNCPLQRIRLIERVQRKWKAEWIDPNPGLVDYVTSKQIVATWEDHKDFLRDEASLAHLTEYNRSLGYMPESPVHLAIQEVFESNWRERFLL